MFRVAALLPVVGIAGAACGGTEPLELASSYTLTTVEGDAQPADGSAHLSVVVPGLVVTVDQVTVEYEAN